MNTTWVHDWLQVAIPFWSIVAGGAVLAVLAEFAVWVTRKARRPPVP